jgi:hypothetical protein
MTQIPGRLGCPHFRILSVALRCAARRLVVQGAFVVQSPGPLTALAGGTETGDGEQGRNSPSRSRPLPLASGCDTPRRIGGPASPRVRPVRAAPARPGPAAPLAKPARGRIGPNRPATPAGRTGPKKIETGSDSDRPRAGPGNINEGVIPANPEHSRRIERVY